MTYSEAVDYIENIPKFTKKTALSHTDLLLDQLGHPEKNLKVIHVAGTNGKGSVCAYLNAMLQKGNYRVGLFTSPHLITINERFQINDQPASDDSFLWAFHRVMEASDAIMQMGEAHPTYFETLFLMGLLIFQREKVDYAILEVGMGGRLDATNVIRDPLACIITSISLDHMEYLGDTVAAIAGEKSGIIKSGIPVIYDAHDPEAAEVIRKRAEEMNSPSFALYADRYQKIATSKSGVVFDFQINSSDKVRLQIPQVADYQMMNASLAFYTMKLLQEGHRISDAELADGIRRMKWACRMETVEKDVIIDGAHNEDGIANFVKTVEHFHADHEITILFGAVVDKRYPDMIREIVDGIHPDRVVTTKIEGHREVSEETFAELFRRAGCKDVYSRAIPAEAYDLAFDLKGEGMLFCVGSLYLAGELKKHVLEKNS